MLTVKQLFFSIAFKCKDMIPKILKESERVFKIQ